MIKNIRFLVKASSYAKFKKCSPEWVRKKLKKGKLIGEYIDEMAFVYLSAEDKLTYPNLSNKERYEEQIMRGKAVPKKVRFNGDDGEYLIVGGDMFLGEYITIRPMLSTQGIKGAGDSFMCFFKGEKNSTYPDMEDLTIDGVPFLETLNQ